MLYKRNELRKCSKYSIAKVTGGAGGTGRGASIEYEFNFENKLVSSSDIFDGSYRGFLVITESKEKRYFVSFSCSSPAISRVIWDIPVPDTLSYIPKDGWDGIPYSLDK